jgi:hypothetical protein
VEALMASVRSLLDFLLDSTDTGMIRVTTIGPEETPPYPSQSIAP